MRSEVLERGVPGVAAGGVGERSEDVGEVVEANADVERARALPIVVLGRELDHAPMPRSKSPRSVAASPKTLSSLPWSARTSRLPSAWRVRHSARSRARRTLAQGINKRALNR